MNEREALIQSALHHPEDDLPRLILADWLQEHEEPDFAAFIRAQCERAATPEWEPFAVQCRTHHPEWIHGRPFRDHLPHVDGRLLEWHPDRAFHRGFGHSLIVRQLGVFLQESGRLFDQAPIDELHLPTATLDEWHRFARQPWLPRIRSIHFYGTRTPIEPIRVLSDSPLSTGIEEIVFEKSNSPAMSILLDDLLRFPLGGQLTSLELRVGSNSIDELLEIIAGSDVRLKRLALVTMPTPYNIMQTYASPALSRLKEIELKHFNAIHLPDCNMLQSVVTTNCRLTEEDFVDWFHQPGLFDLRRVDFSDNVLNDWSTLCAEADHPFHGHLRLIRSFRAARCRMPSYFVRDQLVGSEMWSNLVELDLSGNLLDDEAGEALIHAPRPPDLTALILNGNSMSEPMKLQLHNQFGEAIFLDDLHGHQ